MKYTIKDNTKGKTLSLAFPDKNKAKQWAEKNCDKSHDIEIVELSNVSFE